MRTGHLEVWRGGESERVPLDGESLTVGRDFDNDVALPDDRAVSRRHAVFEQLPGGWWIRDLGSTNGTYVNGVEVVGERPVFAGDEIRVGDTRLVFRDQPR